MAEVPDESQRRAIYAPADQSVLVTAPPGYGKTFVMPKRVAFLIKSAELVPPQRALGLTFTNAAASEMLSRLQRYVRRECLDYIDAMTFHSFCYRALRAYGSVIGLGRDFGILPEGKKQRLFTSFVKAQGLAVHDDPSEYARWEGERILKLRGANSAEEPLEFVGFWDFYRTHQLEEREVDFNHLLWFTYELFQEYPEILDIYRRVYEYILVDEFQDTNPIQFALLDLLVRGDAETSIPNRAHRPVFMFADDWQSIYGFLGAVPKVQIGKAKELFGCQQVELAVDHRTSSPALSLFGQMLRGKNVHVVDKKAGQPLLFILDNPSDLAQNVDAQVETWVNLGIPLHETAILARHKWQLERIREALSYDFLSVPDLQAGGLEQTSVFKVLMELSKCFH